MDPNQQPNNVQQPNGQQAPSSPAYQTPVAPLQNTPYAVPATETPPAPAQPGQPMFTSSQPFPNQSTVPIQPYQSLTQPAFSAPQTITGSQISAQRNLKKPLMIAGIVLAVLLLCGGLFLAFKGGNPISSIASSVTGNKDVVDRSDGTLDLSNLIDEQTTIKTQSLTAKLNQQVNLSDGTSYLVKSVSRNYVPSVKTLVAHSGKEIVKVDVVIGNRRKTGANFILASFFKIKNSAGGLLTSVYVMKDEIDGAFVSTSIDPGKQVSGFLLYEVDKDEKVTSLNTEDKYENYTTNEKVTISSEVTF